MIPDPLNPLRRCRQWVFQVGRALQDNHQGDSGATHMSGLRLVTGTLLKSKV